MAGLGARLFPTLSKLTSAQVNGYLMDQTIMRFASTAARDAAFGGAGEPTLAEGMTCYLDDTNEIQSYNGSAWVGVASSSTVANVSNGLVYIASSSISNAFNIAGCFSSAYTNYRIVFNIDTHTGAAANVVAYPLLGTTPNTTAANYIVNGQEQPFASPWGVVLFGKNGSGAGWEIGRVQGDGSSATFIADIFNPFATVRTFFKSEYTDGGYSGRTAGYVTVTTSYDGIRFTGPTMTGTVIVYGYRK
jgi:hypothetical protein